MSKVEIPDNPPDGMEIILYSRNDEYGIIGYRYVYHKNTPAMEVLDEWYRDRNPKDFVDEWAAYERHYDIGKDSDLKPREWSMTSRVSTKHLKEATFDSWHLTFEEAAAELSDWLLKKIKHHEQKAASMRDKFEWVLREWP